jgi:hypothetical protein
MDTISINRAAKTLALNMAHAKGLRAAEAIRGRGIFIEGKRTAVIGCSEPYSNLNYGYWKDRATAQDWLTKWARKHAIDRVLFVFLKSEHAYIASPEDIAAYCDANEDGRPRVFEDKLPAKWRWA